MVGQKRIRENITSLLKCDSLPPHILLIGGAGEGKTHLAKEIYKMAKAKYEGELILVHITRGESLKKPEVLQAELCRCGASPTVFFLDEIHNLSPRCVEALYAPMDEGELQVYTRRAYTLLLPPLMIIGATTDPGLIPRPLLSRFTVLFMEPYTTEEIADILVEKKMRKDAAITLAQRSRNNPRLALQHLGKIKRIVPIKDITEDIVVKVMDDWDIDAFGLRSLDWDYLLYLSHIGRASIASISTVLGVDSNYIANEIEPYLVKVGFISKETSGRSLTPLGVQFISKEARSGYIL